MLKARAGDSHRSIVDPFGFGISQTIFKIFLIVIEKMAGHVQHFSDFILSLYAISLISGLFNKKTYPLLKGSHC